MWSFVPLVAYHAGGGAASFWPPSQHIRDYDLALAMHMSFGIAACYRGPGLCAKLKRPLYLEVGAFLICCH